MLDRERIFGPSGDAQISALRAMTMGQRWQAAEDLYFSARELKAGAVRALHPDWSEERVLQAVRESFLHVGT